MSALPERHLQALPFNVETGELHETTCLGCQEKADELEGLKSRTASLAGQLTKAKRELARMQGVEPDSGEVREVLEYARDRIRPDAHIIPGSPAWKKVKDRLAEVDVEGRKVYTVADLKLAVDGVLLSDYHVSNGYVKPETIFRDAGTVQDHRDRALGWQAEIAPILKLPIALRQANLDYLADMCDCGCPRIEHAKPGEDGKAPCRNCDLCLDFDDTEVQAEAFHQRVAEDLRRRPVPCEGCRRPVSAEAWLAFEAGRDPAGKFFHYDCLRAA